MKEKQDSGREGGERGRRREGEGMGGRGEGKNRERGRERRGQPNFCPSCSSTIVSHINGVPPRVPTSLPFEPVRRLRYASRRLQTIRIC